MMDISMEIRKLPYSHQKELANILDYNESWKKLMAIIPKILEKDNYECNVSRTNPHKYHSEHFKLLENASINMQKMCPEILFNEWGTSGRVRPALGHLLHLLTKAELYRAADYVAVDLLNQLPPARPPEGPAALVTTTLPDPHLREVERLLDSMKYPESVISNLMNNSRDVNLNYSRNTMEENNNHAITVPAIVISEPETERRNGLIPSAVENRRRRMHRQDASVIADTVDTSAVSDMMKFSKTIPSSADSDMMQFSKPELNSVSSTNIPAVINSDISNISQSQDYLPNISTLNMTSTTIQSSAPTEEDLPVLSDLLENTSATEAKMQTDSDRNNNSGDVVPNLSMLGVVSQSIAETNETINQKPTIVINVIQSGENLSMPQLSTLLSNNNIICEPSDSKRFLPIRDIPSETSSLTSSKNSNASSELSQNSNVSRASRPNCVSPLPNLSLNTLLPHFTYCEVETATNYFDETPHKNCRQVENPFAITNGRFLGSGAFGSVYLGLSLIEKPVAIKKLFLNNMDVVNVDDPITKQFINEVEVLSKYKHENLLSLVGYSCDGPTYCLLYEFIPGGALKDRLQTVEEKLMWTDRLYIALGTSRAIAYLHTAYSTPLIHRDIKTANILLDCTNKPKLCDFGLIKLIPNQNTSATSCAFGTSAYMAREAFRGDVSVKLDTYSFGVVLLELITGLPPLDENREGCDIVTHVEEVCEDDSIAPLIDLKAGSWVAQNINFGEELYKIAVRCLEQNRKKRPTMVEVMEELAELIKKCA
ncbi:hypothetical protein ILUMI_25538 [Ignelater luminosus]|uniref:non-specific serine/threonine protein kinase n=1 Tax=Ignelater luminosus TaxID=2038154 RepID=A0A8K0C5F0_IGNLU|nr:hypothetical protein ILUMI_25538 [Ignelater luminosus]